MTYRLLHAAIGLVRTGAVYKKNPNRLHCGILTFTRKRPVKVIRLLARDTVEEIMYSCAVSKLHLTNTIIEE